MRNRGMDSCPDYNQRIYPMNNMKKLALAVLLTLNMTCAFCQKSDTIKQKSNNTWYVMADIPSLAISGDRSYMKCNFLQGYGFGFEYVINGKIAHNPTKQFVLLGVYSGEPVYINRVEVDDMVIIQNKSFGLGNVWYAHLIPEIIGNGILHP